MLKFAHNGKITVSADGSEDTKWVEPFFFVQAADTQYGLISHFGKPNITEKDHTWDEEIELSRKMVKTIQDMNPKPKFAIICGDMVDAMPGTMWDRSQRADFLREFKDIDVPLVCTCGNHDVGDTPTGDALEYYCKTFGEDRFTFWVGGVFCIVLNSQLFKDDSLVKKQSCDQDAWLEEQLRFCRETKPKHVIVFQHISWYLYNYDEKAEYFNLSPELRNKWLPKFRDAGIKIVFCGHYHRNAGGHHGDMEMVTTSAIGKQIGDDLSGYRIVKVMDHSVTHQYYDLDSVPTVVNCS